MDAKYPVKEVDPKLTKIVGYDFNKGINYPDLITSHLTTGFQASNLSHSI